MAEILSIEALDDLITDLYDKLSDEETLSRIVININRKGRINDFLELMNLSSLLQIKNTYSPYKNGKILVIGKSEVSADKLLMVAGKIGIDKSRFELYLEYEDAKRFPYEKTQWNPNYSLILVGPQGHSGVSKGDYGSAIARIEQEEGFPPVIRLGRDGLKAVSKSMFKEALCEAVENGWIETNKTV